MSKMANKWQSKQDSLPSLSSKPLRSVASSLQRHLMSPSPLLTALVVFHFPSPTKASLPPSLCACYSLHQESFLVALPLFANLVPLLPQSLGFNVPTSI